MKIGRSSGLSDGNEGTLRPSRLNSTLQTLQTALNCPVDGFGRFVHRLQAMTSIRIGSSREEHSRGNTLRFCCRPVDVDQLASIAANNQCIPNYHDRQQAESHSASFRTLSCNNCNNWHEIARLSSYLAHCQCLSPGGVVQPKRETAISSTVLPTAFPYLTTT